jgi:L-fuconolactonase
VRWKPWATNLRELVRRDNLYCKVSGMVTESIRGDGAPNSSSGTGMFVLEAFGPKRLMFGSDWPVCLSHTSYARWRQIVDEWIAPLSPSEQSTDSGLTLSKHTIWT